MVRAGADRAAGVRNANGSDADARDEAVRFSQVHADSLQALLGVAPADIAGLPAAQRGFALRRVDAAAADQGDLPATLGALRLYDTYFLLTNAGFPASDPEARSGDAFVDELHWVRTFITNASDDRTVVPTVIPTLLAAWPGVASVTVQQGTIDVVLADGTRRTIRFPSYQAGHMVAVRQPAALHDDVGSFLQ